VAKMLKQKVIEPREIFQRLAQLSSTLRPGRQEDAHEFIRVLLDELQEACLRRAKKNVKINKQLQYTSVIYNIWGGKLRSQVHCKTCGRDSNTDDPILGVSLATSSSLQKSFQHYCIKEHLSGSERYFCENCNKKRDAYKQMSILRAPTILAVHLKRFEFSMTGNRIKKTQHVRFDSELNITPFLTDPTSAQAHYRLFSVLVHSGHSAYGGHYFSYVKSPGSERWYCMNDSSVSPVNYSKVQSSQAYILFYQLVPEILCSRFPRRSSTSTATPHPQPTVLKHPSGREQSSRKYRPETAVYIPKDITFTARLFPNGISRKKSTKKPRPATVIEQLTELKKVTQAAIKQSRKKKIPLLRILKKRSRVSRNILRNYTLKKKCIRSNYKT